MQVVWEHGSAGFIHHFCVGAPPMQFPLPLHLHQLYMAILTHVTADGGAGSLPANVYLERYSNQGIQWSET